MQFDRVWLRNFRNYGDAVVGLGPGLTAVVGDNGQGKTNLVEALAFLARLESFRGVPTEALVRRGAEQAVLRAEVVHQDGRQLLVEAEVAPGGRTRVFVNRQRLTRSRDLLGAVRVSVFSPDDLAVVQGGPAERRRYLDDALVALHPVHDGLRRDVDRIVRQRTTLLKQSGGRLDAAARFTLDVWDAKLAEAGEALGGLRARLAAELEPLAAKAYGDLSGAPGSVRLAYAAPWRRTGLARALADARDVDVRRGVTSVGPHRDDLEIELNGLPGRTHASRGEQRSLALAARLAAHHAVIDRVGEPPVLLLDDVLSELDADRAHALLVHLPPGQVVITTAGPLPAAARPERVVHVRAGSVV